TGGPPGRWSRAARLADRAEHRATEASGSLAGPLRMRGPVSEEPVQLEEVQPRVLAGELRYAVRVAHPGAQLHELHRRQLVQQAPASLCIVRHAPVRIEVLCRDLEIVAAGEGPVGFHQSRERLHPATGKAAVIDEVGLAEPGDIAGLQSAEHSPGAPAAGGGRVVVVGGRTEPPQRLDPGELRARLLAVAGAGAAGGAVAHGELRIPVTLQPAELHALI